jgi:YbbR domain-containing protein
MIKGISRGADLVPVSIMEPDSIIIQLDRFEVKRVPISPKISFIPVDGYIQVGDVILYPDSINISGPKSLVNDIMVVYTKEMEFRNVLKKIKGKIPVLQQNSEIIHYSLKNITFETDIQRIHEDMLSGIPVTVTHIPRGINIDVVPSTLSLKLQGGVEMLKQLEKNDIQATIDFRSRTRYKYKRIPATIKVPKEISFSDVKPKFFELVIKQ